MRGSCVSYQLNQTPRQDSTPAPNWQQGNRATGKWCSQLATDSAAGSEGPSSTPQYAAVRSTAHVLLSGSAFHHGCHGGP